MKTRHLNIALIWLAAFAGGARANLLLNGSFEGLDGAYAELGGGSSSISGWTTTKSGVEWFNPSSSASGIGSAADGQDAIDLANFVYVGGGIKQTFLTAIGQSYEVSFDAGNVDYAGRDGSASIDVLIDGNLAQSVQDTSATPVIGWNTYNVGFTAQSESTTLEFQNNQDPFAHFALLDNVDVEQAPEAVPEPGIFAAFGLGALTLLLGRGSAKKA